MKLLILLNVIAVVGMVFYNLAIFMYTNFNKKAMEFLLVTNNCINSVVKIVSASIIVNFLTNKIYIGYFKYVVALSILYLQTVGWVFTINNYFDSEKNFKIYSLFRTNKFLFLVQQTKIIIFKNPKSWLLTLFYIMTDDSVFFVKGCQEISFIASFID